ncbi:MAG: enoyl-CoA hydratase/isomerase family protein [Thermodesulfobacteriota bacterium]|nr:enoyl-CoA hydratase/isomerase family protein [Thermodesulfobacteriota bacterium]
MDDNLIIVEKQDHICTITLNRPEKRNSLSPPLLLQFIRTMESLNEDQEIRVVVIRGAGNEAFSAGYSIFDIPKGMSPDDMEALKKINPLLRGLEVISEYRYPVIAMINGFALGAGCEFAATCDVRIATDKSKLGMPPAKLGVLYSYSGHMRFVNLIGEANAKELFLTGRMVSAQRAKEMGLVSYVVSEDDLLSVTYDMAAEIAHNAPLSVSGSKTIINKCVASPVPNAEDEAFAEKLIAHCMSSEDLKEGQTAFMEKRKPVFQGK